MTVGAQKKIDAITHLTRMTVDGLVTDIELRPALFLEKQPADTADPIAAARNLRKSWGISPGPVYNVLQLLESSGVIVVIREFGTVAQDAVTTWPQRSSTDAMIVLNSGLAPDRQRFTLAHELGHLVLHSEPGEHDEDEANAFASEFLAPAEDIQPDLLGLRTSDFPKLLKLKEKWGLSIAALIRRARDLSLISDRQYTEFQFGLNRLGWKKVEPGEVAVERAHVLGKIIDARFAHGQTLEEIAALAKMTPAAFSRLYRPVTQPQERITLSLEAQN